MDREDNYFPLNDYELFNESQVKELIKKDFFDSELNKEEYSVYDRFLIYAIFDTGMIKDISDEITLQAKDIDIVLPNL